MPRGFTKGGLRGVNFPLASRSQHSTPCCYYAGLDGLWNFDGSGAFELAALSLRDGALVLLDRGLYRDRQENAKTYPTDTRSENHSIQAKFDRGKLCRLEKFYCPTDYASCQRLLLY